jgi:hypothetical protein
MPPPSAFSAPQYYTPEQQAFSNQVPGMYNISNGGNMPMNNGPPPSAASPIAASITPAVRKMDDSESGPDKKPRVDAEPEWQTPQIVSLLYTHIKHILIYVYSLLSQL